MKNRLQRLTSFILVLLCLTTMVIKPATYTLQVTNNSQTEPVVIVFQKPQVRQMPNTVNKQKNNAKKNGFQAGLNNDDIKNAATSDGIKSANTNLSSQNAVSAQQALNELGLNITILGVESILTAYQTGLIQGLDQAYTKAFIKAYNTTLQQSEKK